MLFQSFFCGEKKSAERFDLPNHAVLSESGEVTDFILSQQVRMCCFSFVFFLFMLNWIVFILYLSPVYYDFKNMHMIENQDQKF